MNSRMITLALHDLGRQEEFEATIALLQESSADPDVIAAIYAWAGNADATFELLDKLLEQFGCAPQVIFYDPLFQKVFDDPRWHQFQLKNGYAPEQLAAIPFDVKIPK